MIPEIQTAKAEVICCQGPPHCPFKDDAAIQNQLDGCPLCKRLLIQEDGTEFEYRTQTQ